VNLHVLPAGPIQTNAYLLTAPERGEAVLIDAPTACGRRWTRSCGKKMPAPELCLTHGHWDHTQARRRSCARRTRKCGRTRRTAR